MSAAPIIQEQPQQNPLAVAEPTLTPAEKFVARVEKQFAAEMGSPVAWTQLQKTLAQHLFAKIDAQLNVLEIKRSKDKYKKDDPEITWANVNMTKLAVDAVSRVSLELDAFLPNQINVIPYLNGRTGKYDVDLRIGYMGVDAITRKFALDPVLDIEYQLVHETDKFSYGTRDGVAYRNFEQTSPFSPGEVIGGYVYVTYNDPRKNKVIIVEYREFEKAMKASGGTQFWGGVQKEWADKPGGGRHQVETGYDEKFRKEMMFKTVVLRGCKKLALDPAKINSVIASELDAIDVEVTAEADTYANQEILSLSDESETLVNVTADHVVIPKADLVEVPAQPTLTGDEPAKVGPGY